jgi:protease YdgD
MTSSLSRRSGAAALLLLALAVAADAAATVPPMAAVGRLRFGGDSSCSGTLIASDLVLTAGHCVLLPDGSGPLPAGGIVFTTGAYPAHEGARFAATDVVVHPLYIGAGEEAAAMEWLPHDAALIRLAQPVPAEVAGPIEVVGPEADVEETFLASYRGGRGQRARERRCPVLQEWPEMVALTCDVRPGESGSPVIVSRDGRLGLYGIVSARTRTMRTETALAVRADRLVKAMQAVMGPPSDP